MNFYGFDHSSGEAVALSVKRELSRLVRQSSFSEKIRKNIMISNTNITDSANFNYSLDDIKLETLKAKDREDIAESASIGYSIAHSIYEQCRSCSSLTSQ